MNSSEGRYSRKRRWICRMLSGVLAAAMLAAPFVDGVQAYAEDSPADAAGSGASASAAEQSAASPAASAAATPAPADWTNALSCAGSLQENTPAQGDTAVVWTIRVDPEGGALSLAGMQLKLAYDPAQLTFVSAGAALQNAGSAAESDVSAAFRTQAGDTAAAVRQDTLLYDFPADACAPVTLTVTMQLSDALLSAPAAAEIAVAASLAADGAAETAALPQEAAASVPWTPAPTAAPSASPTSAAGTEAPAAPAASEAAAAASSAASSVAVTEAPAASASSAASSAAESEAAAGTNGLLSGIGQFFLQLFGAPAAPAAPAAVYTATVTNTAYNYPDGGTVSFRIDKAATVTISGIDQQVAAGGTFAVPCTCETFTVETAETPATLTLDSASSGGCLLLAPASQTLTDQGTAAFVSQIPLANVSLYKKWYDGALSNKATDGMTLGLQYLVAGETQWTDLTAATMGSLGYTSLPAVPERTGADSNESVWKYDFTSVLAGYTAKGKTVQYRLSEPAVPAGYVSSYAEDGGISTLCNTLKKPFSATVKWLDAADAYQTRISPDAWIAGLSVTRGTILGSDTPQKASTDPKDEFYVQVTDAGDGTWTVSMPNALAYDSNNFAYTYSLLQQASIPAAQGALVPGGSTYEPEYSNVDVHASNAEQLFSGGTVTDKLANTTRFTATKQWMDDGEPATIAARPSAAVTLYRYAKGKGDYTTASPVSLAGEVLSGVPVDNTAAKGTAITVTLPAESGKTLPLFDEDGYQYVYFVKETLTGGSNAYAQVFDNQSSDDYGEKGSGKTDTARYLFNGGTLNNTITGTVGREVTKEWIAAARQDVDAKVTVAVDQSDPGDLSGAPVLRENYATQVLTGFSAEITAKTASFTGLPKYNAYGLPYTYTVREAKVETKAGSEYAAATEQTENGNQYLVTADGYRYLQKTVTEANGNVTLQNILVGNAQVVIRKTFPNGLLANTAMTYRIYRNGTEIGSVTASYLQADHPQGAFTPDPLTITRWEDLTENLTGQTGLLPRYDADGAEYSYTVAETDLTPANTYGHTDRSARSDAVYTDGAYDGEHYLAVSANISNYAPGKGVSVSVYKNWVDDGDELYHSTVSFELQYNAGTEAAPQWTKVAAGSIPTNAHSADIAVAGTAASGTAYADLYKNWVSGGHVSGAADAFRVVETKLGNSDVQLNAQVSAADHPEHETAAVLVNGRDQYWSFVSTPDQNYDVSPEAAYGESHEGSSWDFTLTNKRVGVEKIRITKVWKDGADQGNTRPASVAFTVTASEAVFDGSTTKEFTVPSSAAQAETPDTWVFETGWLTKYDDSGAVIDYTVAESADTTAALAALHYASHAEKTEYTVGAQHTGDVLSCAFTNQLSGTVKPYMNKIWMDTGTDAQMRLRPDIYPVLIRSYTDADNITHYEKMGFTERDWDTEKITKNWWTCTFVPQDRYTEDGFAYTYFVGEEFTTANLNDYFCSGGYTNEPDAAGDFTEEEANRTQKVTVTENGVKKSYIVAPLNSETGKGGTLVNKPAAVRTVSGSKTWVMLPAEFSRGNLPAVTFQLYRCTYDSYKQYGDGREAVLVTQAVDENGNALPVQAAGFTTTMPAGTSSFAFSGNFPKYDAAGKPYYYVVRETAPQNMDVIYTVTNDPMAGLVVQNSYKRDQNFTVSFTKNWANTSGADLTAYASKIKFTLTLVRYLTDADGNAIARTREATFAAAGTNGNGNTVTLPYNAGASDTLTWNHLAYYAPNGRPYEYRVEETNLLGGWTASAGGTALTAAKLDSGASGYAVRVADDNSQASGAGTAALTNTYGDVKGGLQLVKNWAKDEVYGISARPDSVTLQLNRTAGGVSETVGTSTLSAQSGWKASVSDLQIYAPDGTVYAYSVQEPAVPAGYTAASTPASVQAAGTSVPVLTTTNTAQRTSLTIRKVWAMSAGTDDAFGSNAAARLLFEANLGSAAASIRYHVAYSTDDGASWNVLQKNDAAAVWTVTAAKGVYKDQTAADLPQKILVGGVLKDVRYTAYEYSVTIGKTTYTRASDSPGAADFGSLQASAAVPSGTTDTITNTVPLRRITITKVWADQSNRDGQRAPLTFTITRTGVNSASDTAKATVVLTKENAVAGDPDRWSATYDVPLLRNDSSTEMSSYTVEETSGVSTEYRCESGTDGAAWVSPAAGAAPAVALGSTAEATAAWFRNTKSFDTFTLQATKQWQYHGSAVTAPTLAEYKKYFPDSLTFTLEYSTDQQTWQKADQLVSGLAAEQPAAVDAETGAVAEVTWSGLPKAQETGDVNTQKPYYYRVTESASGPFAVSYAQNDSGSTWTAGNVVVGTSAKTNGTAEVRTTNSLSLTTLAVTKTWEDADNRYNTRPDAVRYEIQRSVNGTDWTDVPAVWLEGGANPVDAAYSVTFARLPQAAPDGTAYQYRALEVGLVSGGTSVAPGDGAPYRSATQDGKAFVNTLNTAEFTFEKAWGADAAGISSAVTGVVVRLQRTISTAPQESDWTDVAHDGTGTEWQIDRDASGAITKTWSDLPARDADGNAYTYRAAEVALIVKNGGVSMRAEAVGTALAETIGGFAYAADTVNDATAHRTVVTNTPVTASLKVTKQWDDADDQDGIRPDSLPVSLTAGSSLFAALPLGTLAAQASLADGTSAGWEYVWNNAPVMDAAGNAIRYTLTETGTAGYTASHAAAGGTPAAGTAASVGLTANRQTAVVFTNTHVPAQMSVTAEKVWQSDVAADRPAALTYTLQRAAEGSSTWTDVDVQTVPVDAATGACRYVWTGLPVCLAGENGVKLHYRVAETAVAGYTAAWSAQDLTGSVLAAAGTGENAKTATVTNTMIQASLTAEKIWQDPYGLDAAVQTTMLQLQRKTAAGTDWTDYLAAQPAAKGTDSCTWTGLPSCDADGNPLVYRAREASIVLKDGTTVSAAGTAEAGTVGGYRYAAQTTGGAGSYETKITNTIRTGALAVSKRWEDDGDREALRPQSLTVRLDAAVNGTAAALTDVAASTVLNEANGWADNTTWAAVPAADAAGTAIAYTLTEDTVAGYTPFCAITGGASGSSYTAAATAGVTAGQTTAAAFVNTHVMTTLTVTASKIWADNNAYGDRPAGTAFTLYANYRDAAGAQKKEKVTADEAGAAVSNPVTLTSKDQNAADANRWDVSWSGLPQYKTGLVGSSITYTVEEAAVPGYDAAVNGGVITNTMRETALTVNKVWGAEAVGDAQDVTDITYALQRRTEDTAAWDTVETQTVARGQNGAFSHTWSALPQYSSAGRAYTYRAVELSLTKGGTSLPLTATDGSGEAGYLGTFFTAKAVTEGSSEAGYVTTVVNDRTQADFRFAKAGANDELDLTKTAPLAGAVFGLYADAACAEAPLQKAASDAAGTVLFEKIPCGTFYIREISAPDNYLVNTEIYPVTVDEKGAARSEKLAAGSPADTVADEAVRGSFTMVKVDEADPAVKIPGATYSLYKKAAGKTAAAHAAPDGYLWIEDGVTGADGTVTFPNLLIGTDYLIRETKAPAGYQLSEKAVGIAFLLAQNGRQAEVKLTDSGSGTVQQNSDGSFTWIEPPTQVAVRKQDAGGALLAGAKLRIVDAAGNVVESWTSDGTEHLLSGVLTAGAEYTLQETAAPDGYDLAAPVQFTVEAREQAPGVLYTQTVRMTDEQTPAVNAPRTGDRSPLLWLLAVQLCGCAGLALAHNKRKKQRLP